MVVAAGYKDRVFVIADNNCNNFRHWSHTEMDPLSDEHLAEEAVVVAID